MGHCLYAIFFVRL